MMSVRFVLSDARCLDSTETARTRRTEILHRFRNYAEAPCWCTLTIDVSIICLTLRHQQQPRDPLNPQHFSDIARCRRNGRCWGGESRHGADFATSTQLDPIQTLDESL